MRISKSDVNYRGELREMLMFVHCTLKGKRCLVATSLDEIFTWVDASYAVHHDMKIHNGGVVFVVLGVTHFRSSKKILNMKSSTKAELVGASDYVPYNIW